MNTFWKWSAVVPPLLLCGILLVCGAASAQARSYQDYLAMLEEAQQQLLDGPLDSGTLEVVAGLAERHDVNGMKLLFRHYTAAGDIAQRDQLIRNVTQSAPEATRFYLLPHWIGTLYSQSLRAMTDPLINGEVTALFTVDHLRSMNRCYNDLGLVRKHAIRLQFTSGELMLAQMEDHEALQRAKKAACLTIT